MKSEPKTTKVNLDVDISKIKSPVLLRLVEEVRNQTPDTVRCFDRVHTRHNRS